MQFKICRSRKYVRTQPTNKRKIDETEDDPLEQWKETKIPLEDQVIANEFIEVFQQRKKAFDGITQQIAANEVCELAESKIGFGQSAVHKILKKAELPANTLTRNAIKSWIEKNRIK